MTGTITETVPESDEARDNLDDDVVHVVCEFCYPLPFEQYDFVPTLCGRAADPNEWDESTDGPWCKACVTVFQEHKKGCP